MPQLFAGSLWGKYYLVWISEILMTDMEWLGIWVDEKKAVYLLRCYHPGSSR